MSTLIEALFFAPRIVLFALFLAAIAGASHVPDPPWWPKECDHKKIYEGPCVSKEIKNPDKPYWLDGRFFPTPFPRFLNVCQFTCEGVKFTKTIELNDDGTQTVTTKKDP